MTGFEHFLKQIRSHNLDSIVSTENILLPFQVQTNTSLKFNLEWCKNGTKVVYGELCWYDDQNSAAYGDSASEMY